MSIRELDNLELLKISRESNRGDSIDKRSENRGNKNHPDDDFVNYFSADRFDPMLTDEQIRERYRFDLFEDTKAGAENVEKSTRGISSKASVSTKKVKHDTIAKRLGSLGLACFFVAGIAVTSRVVNTIHHNSIVNPYTISLRKNVVSPNTHRTDNGLYYFFDYDDISEYLKVEGEDFSKRLYITVECIGQNQTDQVLEYVDGVNSVDSYVKDKGFESVDEWKDNEFKKLEIEKDIAKESQDVKELKEELGAMFSDPYVSPIQAEVDVYGGAK